MKVLLIATSFLPRVGGRELYQDRVLTRFAGDEVVVVTPDREGDYDAFDRDYRFRVIRCGDLEQSWFARGRRAKAVWFAELARLCLKEHPDVVLCGTVFPDGLSGWLIYRTLGIPYVVHAVGKDLLTATASQWSSARLSALCATASKFVAASNYIGRLLIDQGIPENRVAVAMPGVDQVFLGDDDGSANRIRDRYGLHAGKTILTVGRLVERKGHDKVIEAMPTVLRHVPDAVYLIVGDGPDRGRLEALVRKLGLEHKVVFAGVLPAEEIPAAYSMSDVFVMPNRKVPGDIEGFGIVFLEANARGLPVIGGRSGGAQDAVADGKSGFLVDPLDANQIAQTLIKLLTDPDLARRLGERGRQRVLARFSWERAAAKVRSVIERAARTPAAWRQAKGPPFVRRAWRMAETVLAPDDALLRQDADALRRPTKGEG